MKKKKRAPKIGLLADCPLNISSRTLISIIPKSDFGIFLCYYEIM